MTGTHFKPAPLGVSRFLIAAALALSLGLFGAAADAGDGKQRLKDYLKGLRSLQSSFEQITFNAERTSMMQARGTFYLQRPGRFRWEYDTPNKQVIIADGKRVYVHDIDLDQVSHQSQSKALRGTPALLLADDAPIGKHFKTKSIASTDGRDWVELIPKDKETEVVKIELGFGAKELESMIMEDSFGQTTRLDFGATRRNPSLDRKLFKMDQRAMDEFFSLD